MFQIILRRIISVIDKKNMHILQKMLLVTAGIPLAFIFLAAVLLLVDGSTYWHFSHGDVFNCHEKEYFF